MKIKNCEKLLRNILECTNIDDVLNNKPSKCTNIVYYQLDFLKENEKAESSENRRLLAVPEPWSGDILNAQIMFLSSNPSISMQDFEDNKYPLHYVDDENSLLFNEEKDYYDFFTNRFQKETYTSNKEFLAVPFWRTIEDWYLKITNKKNSNDLVSKINTHRGKDFVITELVHCKSKSEIGVSEAMDSCFDKWFEKIIQICKAKTIIILGAKSRNKILTWLYPENRAIINERGRYIEPYPKIYTLFNKKLNLVFFPHPSARYGLPDLQSFIQKAYEKGFYGKENKEKIFDLKRLQIRVQRVLNRG